jgi:hypothetical protein
MGIEASGVEPGLRQLNGVQTTGRDYRTLSEVEFGIRLWLSINAQRNSGERPHPNKREETCSGPTLLGCSQLLAPMCIVEAAVHCDHSCR